MRVCARSSFAEGSSSTSGAVSTATGSSAVVATAPRGVDYHAKEVVSRVAHAYPGLVAQCVESAEVPYGTHTFLKRTIIHVYAGLWYTRYHLLFLNLASAVQAKAVVEWFLHRMIKASGQS